MQKFAHVVTAVALFASVGLPAIACDEEAKNNKTSVQPEQKTTVAEKPATTTEPTKVAEGTAKKECDPSACSKNKEAKGTEGGTTKAEETKPVDTPATATAPKETTPGTEGKPETEKPKQEAAKPEPSAN